MTRLHTVLATLLPVPVPAWSGVWQRLEGHSSALDALLTLAAGAAVVVLWWVIGGLS